MVELNTRIVAFNKQIFEEQIDVYRSFTVSNKLNIKCKSPKFNFFKGIFVAASDPQCVKLEESTPAPTASTMDNEDDLVIDMAEEELFLSEGEYEEVDETKKLKDKERSKQRKELQLKIKSYLSK